MTYTYKTWLPTVSVTFHCLYCSREITGPASFGESLDHTSLPYEWVVDNKGNPICNECYKIKQ